MRIIFLRSNPVLPDPRVEKEVKTLINYGHEVKILAWNRVTKSRGKYGKIKVGREDCSIRWFDIRSSFGRGLRNILPLIFFQISILIWLCKHRNKYDIIHACDFDTVIPAWLSSKLFKKKYVYDIFDYYVDAFSIPKILKSFVEKIDIFMINSADAVIIVNESRKVQIAKSNPKKLFIIHNSPDITLKEESRNSNNLMSNTVKPKFVYIGILSNGRMLIDILDVFLEHKEWELHIGGFGVNEDLIRDIAKKSQNIYFYGKVSYDTAIEIEVMCNVFFAVYDPSIPNHKYSSPNKLYEAMILGKPIIVAKGTGIDVIVDSNNLGISIEYTKKDFEKAAKILAEEVKKSSLTNNKSKELFKKNYSWDIMSNRLLDLYKQLEI